MKRLRISLFVLAIALTVTGNAFSLFATVNRSGIPLLQNIGSRKSTVKLYPGMVVNIDKTDGDYLAGRLNLARLGMSGHSFGAVTAQAVSGQSFPTGGQRFTDTRIKAAIAFSPAGDAEMVR